MLLVKLQAQLATLLKVIFLHGCFSCFLNCTNGTKLCNASYMKSDYLQRIENGTNYNTRTYENVTLRGDLNVQISDTIVGSFCAIHKFSRLLQELSCCKNLKNQTCIDLITFNFPKDFQEFPILETGLSDFHEMILTVFSEVPYQPPKLNILSKLYTF